MMELDRAIVIAEDNLKLSKSIDDDSDYEQLVLEQLNEAKLRSTGCEYCRSDALDSVGTEVMLGEPKVVFYGGASRPKPDAKLKFCPHCGHNLSQPAIDRLDCHGCERCLPRRSQEDGMILPYPLGTTVYKITKLVSGINIIIKGQVIEYIVGPKDRIFFFSNGNRADELWCEISSFGDTIFSTDIEAAQKLKEIEDK